MSEADLLAIIAIVIVLAVGAEMLGDRLGLPNILFFVLAGLAVGPPGLGLLHQEVFGEGVGAIVGLSVAIIVFHDASKITSDKLRDAPRSAFFLATVGTFITFLGMTAVTYVVLDLPVGISLFVGALLTATGVTAVEPILATVSVRPHLAHTLEIEGVINEVVAAILAVALFHSVTLRETNVSEFVRLFAWHLLVGVLIGAVVAVLVVLLFKIPEHAPERAPQHARLILLATAILAYAAAETVAAEAGIAAVATAGVLLGNAGLPYWEHTAQFEEDVATFLLAFVFVVLASFVEPEWLATVGVGGVLVAVVLMVFVRPIAVLLSTTTADFRRRELLFLSAVAPRGIVPAGVAILFALDIQDTNPAAATTITGTVTLVILITVVVEGGLARQIAEGLEITTETTVIVGGGPFGLALADRYVEQGEQVKIIETDLEKVEAARNDGYTVHHGDGTNPDVLKTSGAARAKRIVAATDDDNTNLVVARLAQSKFDLDTILARVNEDNNREAYEELGVEVASGAQLELWALDRLVDQSAPDWLDALKRTGSVATVSMTSDDVIGRTVADLDSSAPDRVMVVSLTRDGETTVPDGSMTIERGDKVTFLGQASAVDEAVSRFDHAEGSGPPA